MQQPSRSDIDDALASPTAALLRQISGVFGIGSVLAVVAYALVPSTPPLGPSAALVVAACIVGAIALRLVDLEEVLRGERRRWIIDGYPLLLAVAISTVAPTAEERSILWVAAVLLTMLASVVARPPAVVAVVLVLATDATVDTGRAGIDDWATLGAAVSVLAASAWFATRVRHLYRRAAAAQLVERATSERYARGVETIARLSEVVHDSPPADVVSAVGRTAAELGWSRCRLHVRGDLHAALASGDSPLVGVELLDVGRPGGLLETVLGRGEPVVLDRYGEAADARDEFRHLGLLVGVPVTIGGDVVGALVVGRTEPAPAPTDVRLVELLAAQAMRALEAARTFALQRDTVTGARRAALARDDFVATVSHELRTPIQVLLGMSEVLDERWPAIDERQRRHFVARMHSNAAELAGLVDALMDLTLVDQHPATAHTAVDLVAVVDVVVGRLAPVHDRHVVRTMLPRPGTVVVDGDPLLLDRVVDNLLTNACRHTPAGTAVTVAVERRDDDAVLLVRDDGPGIDAEDLPHVTERFFRGGGHHLRRATRGIGLGLALCEAIVGHHGGVLDIASPPGLGTTVTVRLPRAVGIPPRARDGDGPAPPTAAGTVDEAAPRDVIRIDLDDADDAVPHHGHQPG